MPMARSPQPAARPGTWSRPVSYRFSADVWRAGGASACARRVVPRELARTIRTYRASIEATIEWRLTNWIAESNNAHIGRLRAAARGFHTAKAFITMIYLDRAGITRPLPWAT